METNLYLTAKNGEYDAKAIYKDGVVIVKAGSKIRLTFAEHIRNGRGKKALSYRNDPSYVDEKGIVLKDCAFRSASTASQFVTGSSTNGLVTWRVDSKTKLKKWLEMN